MFLTIVIIAVSILLFIIQSTRKPSTLPPGLPRYPFVGSGHHLAPNLHEVSKKAIKVYGKVFSLYLGNVPCVVVAEFDIFKELMSCDDLLDRPLLGAKDDFFFPDENGQRRGIMFANGKEWQEQRRFTLKNLRDLGFGKTSMESLIQEDIEKCIDLLRKEVGKPTQLDLKLNIAIINALWKLLTGEKLEYDSPKSKEIVKRFNELFKNSNNAGLIFALPWLKYIIPDYIGYTNMKNVFGAVNTIVEETYDKHLETFDAENIRDFTDAYIKQINECENDPNSSFHGTRGKKNFIATITNLFAAGSDTSTNTINFILWYLCKYPNVQIRLQKEIDSVVGSSRMPSLNDKTNLPYLEAVANEVQRIVGLAVTGIFRMAKNDIKISSMMKDGSFEENWVIPKNAIFIPLIHQIMRDPKHFEKPDEFLPERFLDEDGKYRPNEKLVPFGLGKRMCPGKTLADTEIFLFLASFIQRFKFSFPHDQKVPREIEPEVGFILACPSYDITIEER